MAPEVINRNYDDKCDVWSIGVLMYTILVGSFPFGGKNDNEIEKNIKKGKYDKSSPFYKSLSIEAKDLIDQFLIIDLPKRITIEKAIEHQWFINNGFDNYNKINQENSRELINNLYDYRSDDILKCTFIAYLVHNFTNLEECIEASKLFCQFDTSQDGKVDLDELTKGLQKFLGLSYEESSNQAKDIFNNIDTDFNGLIEHEEFIRAAVNSKIFLSEKYLEFAFDYFDSDKSGAISINNIKKKFNQASGNKAYETESVFKDLFKKLNINENGTLEKNYFIRLVKDSFSQPEDEGIMFLNTI